MISSTVVVATALGSACAAAMSSVLQHRSARNAPESYTRNGLSLLAHLLAEPLWLLGLLLAVVGLGLHVAALDGGRLTLVQPLLVSGLLLALPLSVLLDRRRPSLTEWSWAAVVMAGLSIFLVVGDPRGGSRSAGAWPLIVAAAGGVGAMAALTALARANDRWRPVLLAAAGGAGFGVASALTKQCTAIAHDGIVRLLASWPLYAAIAVGVGAVALTQLAYRSGPLAASLPAMTICDPAFAIVIGALAFHEHITGTPLAVTAEVAAFALMTLGTWQLGRQEERSSR